MVSAKLKTSDPADKAKVLRELQRRDPQRMFEEIRELRGGAMDRCMLYVLRAAVYYVNAASVDPELVPWWKWSDRALAQAKPPA